MAITVVDTFYPVEIANVSVKFETEKQSVSFGCTGTLSGETEMRTISAKCGSVPIKEVSKPLKMTGSITGHAKVSVIREIFGLSSKGLKSGIHSYGLDSKGKGFVLTADIVDEFENVTKIIAFPSVVSSTGFKFSIDKSNDEVAPIELEFTCIPDQYNQFYYEGFVDEMDDAELVAEWRNNFSVELTRPTQKKK